MSIFTRHLKNRNCFLPSLDKIWNFFFFFPIKSIAIWKSLKAFFLCCALLPLLLHEGVLEISPQITEFSSSSFGQWRLCLYYKMKGRQTCWSVRTSFCVPYIPKLYQLGKWGIDVPDNSWKKPVPICLMMERFYPGWCLCPVCSNKENRSAKAWMLSRVSLLQKTSVGMII